MPIILLERQYILVVFSLLAAYTLSKFLKKAERLQGVPGPPSPNFLLGHALQRRQSPAGTIYQDWMKQYGYVYKTSGVLFRPILHISDPKAVNHVLMDTSTYNRHVEEKIVLTSWFGETILSSESEEHKRKRKMLNVAFSPQSVKEVSGVMFDLAHRLKGKWEDVIIESSKPSLKFDVTKLAHETTLDAICMTSFMYDCTASSGEIADLLRFFSNAPIFDAKDVLLRTLVTKFPILLQLPSPMAGFARRLRHELGEIAAEVWSGASVSGGMHAKVLDALSNQVNAAGVAINRDEAACHIIEILFAGSETTANVFTECLFELSRQPIVQNKVRNELLQFEEEIGRQPTYDDLHNSELLPYFDAVVRETLRTKGILAYLSRQSTKTDMIPLKYPIEGTKDTRYVEVAPGQRIELMIREGINVSPDIWGPDANEFKPERWLVDGGLPETVADIHAPGNILSFGDGAKICLGRNFAIAELKIFLSVIIRYFTFESDGLELDMYFSGSETYKPYVRGNTKDGVQLPLRVALYE